MITRLLTSVTPWMLAILLGIAVFFSMQARQYEAVRDAALGRAERSEQRAEAMGEVMDWQRNQIRKLSSALAERDELLANDAEHIDQQRDAAQQLERDDDATATWADQPVPDATRQWLRGLGTDAGTPGDDTSSSELPAQAAAGAQPSGES